MKSVGFPGWLTLALATGVDSHTGDPVTIGVEPNLALALQSAIEDGATPEVSVPELAVEVLTVLTAFAAAVF